MAILVDSVIAHGDSNTGNDTVPTGITGLDWCHVVSDTSLLELTTWLTDNLGTVACDPTNVRTPALGAHVTYAGLTQGQRDAAVAAGATEVSGLACFAEVFDSPARHRGTYEP